MAGKEIQLYKVKWHREIFYLHENSITGFWEDNEDKENIKSAIMLTSGKDLIYPVPLSELLAQLKVVINYKLPSENI
ncbi:hypothetical protein [Proteus mirabilis]|uniref:hypothetical protein n=1 Tax=Proteus mirabilis TaxID=584 RepID=UPI000D9D67EB|nr:hypothetical protein [Proteus mirabilis]MBG5954233.1 hypothetical protein [Proteus mirabilis]SPY41082.1 Uncharacterised protein [Proteus mirabilis]HCD1074669.1 hypothetical protein [Proteus mirabilis]HCD1125580.1 hypothetical protein [Proteus mirabilis]HEJ9561308.1 hypothetical protein [Proteus mirabilis]